MAITMLMIYGTKYSLKIFISQTLYRRRGEGKDSYLLAITHEQTPEFDINITQSFTSQNKHSFCLHYTDA